MNELNRPRWRPTEENLYEVWYLKLNHKESGRALWARYSILQPSHSWHAGRGEVWAIAFDPSDAHQHRAIREDVPTSKVKLGAGALVTVGEATLSNARAVGAVKDARGSVSWALDIASDGRQFVHVPECLHCFGLATTHVTSPHIAARFKGSFTVDGTTYECKDESGMQGHIWGSKYGNEWFWFHGSRFEGADDLVIETVSSPVDFPLVGRKMLTAAYASYKGQETVINTLSRAFQPDVRMQLGHYRVTFGDDRRRFVCDVTAPVQAMVEAVYEDTDGTKVHCANSKLATAQVAVEERDGPGWLWIERARYTAASCCALEAVKRRPWTEVAIKVP